MVGLGKQHIEQTVCCPAPREGSSIEEARSLEMGSCSLIDYNRVPVFAVVLGTQGPCHRAAFSPVLLFLWSEDLAELPIMTLSRP